MKKYKKVYRQKSLLGTGNIWMLCDDHLLYVQNKGYTEDYKRFFFDDIKWIKLVSSGFSIFISIVLFLVAALLMLAAFAFYEDKTMIGTGIFAGLSLAFFIGIILNFLLGPGGKLIIMTHTQRDELPVNRFRKGRKLLKKLKEGISQVQGAASSKSELLTHMEAAEIKSGKKIVI